MSSIEEAMRKALEKGVKATSLYKEIKVPEENLRLLTEKKIFIAYRDDPALINIIKKIKQEAKSILKRKSGQHYKISDYKELIAFFPGWTFNRAIHEFINENVLGIIGVISPECLHEVWSKRLAPLMVKHKKWIEKTISDYEKKKLISSSRAHDELARILKAVACSNVSYELGLARGKGALLFLINVDCNLPSNIIDFIRADAEMILIGEKMQLTASSVEDIRFKLERWRDFIEERETQI